jgi:hypothetical protein
MEAHARTTDPETSHVAAASVKELTKAQTAVQRLFAFGTGWADYQLVSEYQHRHRAMPGLYPRLSESGIRTRRKELVDKGVLMDTSRRVKMPSGRMAIVWALVR